eukprot:42464_1
MLGLRSCNSDRNWLRSGLVNCASKNRNWIALHSVIVLYKKFKKTCLSVAIMNYNSKLICAPIWGCQQAPAVLGRLTIERGHKLVPVAFFPSRLPCSFYVIIPKGFVALVNRHGKYVGVWTAGYHTAAPWITISHLIPEQYTVFDSPVKECPTQDNVMVTIDVALIFRVMCEDEKSLYNFCYRLGPDKLDKMLKAFQEEAIRGMVRKRKYNEIYDLMDMDNDKQLDGTKRDLNNHFNEYGIHITSLAVTNVHLPPQFADNMQEESIWGTRDEFNKLEQKFSLQKIQIKELEAKAKQKADEDLTKFTAEKDSVVADEMKKLAKVNAETDKSIAEVREQQSSDVLEVSANSKLEEAKINSQRDVRLSRITEEGKAESQKIAVETSTYVASKKAEAERIIAENKAQCMAMQADAEAEAAKQLAAQREYTKKMRSLQALRGLAQNNNVCIAGNHKDNIVAQLVANQNQGNVLGLNISS